MQIDRQQLLSEIQLRKQIRKMIAEGVKNWSDSKDVEKQEDLKLREYIRSLISEIKQEVNEQDLQSGPEKDMFNLVKKEIAGLLKSSIKTLKDGQAGDAEHVQIGHLKAVILAINNLFDQVESAQGALDKENLKEAIEVDIGDTLEDVTQNPLYMADDVIDNNGDETDDELDIESADAEDIEQLTMDLEDADIQTLYDAIRAQESDPEKASYQILGASRALNKKTGSWNKVRNNFLNFAELVWNAGLPEAAWKTFRKWVVENVRLHLINTIQETASESSMETPPPAAPFDLDDTAEVPAEEVPTEL